MKKGLLIILCVITIYSAFAQPGHETIPASALPEQTWWNLLHYTIDIRPDFESKSLTGINYIEFRAIRPGKVLQLDLMQPLSIRWMTWKQWNSCSIRLRQPRATRNFSTRCAEARSGGLIRR